MPGLHELRPAPGARRRPKRVGRGIGTGHGKTAGRGHKGQKARSGPDLRPGFEGGQMPLFRRIPKRGFKNPLKTDYAEVNVGRLEAFEAHAEVTPEALLKRRIIRKVKDGVKVLGKGELTRPLVVRAHAFSRSALDKIAAAGGRAETISGGRS